MKKSNSMCFATVNNDEMSIDNAVNVKRVASLFACVLDAYNDAYSVIVDSNESDTRACRDDYIHVYRHSTSNAQNRAHNNVFQCYLKHSKECVNVLCNKTNFEAFKSERIEYSKEYKNASLIRYIVAYDDFIAFMHDIMSYDMQRATTSATKESALENVK